MKQILTPKTMLKNRGLLLEKLSSIVGVQKPVIDKKDPKMSALPHNDLDMKEKEVYRDCLKPSFIKIFNTWINRARLLIKIRS